MKAVAVPPEVRTAEDEIDAAIHALPLWQASREALLATLLRVYRETAEALLLAAAYQAISSESSAETDAQAILEMEGLYHRGFFWLFKWALAWCPEAGATPEDEEFVDLLHMGSDYQALADALWMHKQGWGRVRADPSARLLTVFEGGDQTGRDQELSRYLHATIALHRHQSFTHDGDQLALEWTAGDYRALGRALIDECVAKGVETVSCSLTEPAKPLFIRPTVISVPPGLAAKHHALLTSMTMTAEKMAGRGRWNLNNWFDTPFVIVGGRYLCPSNLIETIFHPGMDDHMLRVAAAADPVHYSKVSQLREGRMTTLCVNELSKAGWMCTAPYTLTNPQSDVDLHAVRGGQVLILELKSTLRPESPREVASRNEEIHLGLSKSQERRARFRAGTIAAVVTDGYRGDYRTWADALRRGVPVLTTGEVSALATDPAAFVQRLAQWSDSHPVGSDPLPERETTLMGWRIVLRDEA